MTDALKFYLENYLLYLYYLLLIIDEGIFRVNITMALKVFEQIIKFSCWRNNVYQFTKLFELF